ncbi:MULTISPECIES: GNAT family N-acetyltransferase [Pseudoalteromonas]|uniref:GNAT family N-acetyltransferase n=1 Tax=Pseudoalteromonas amylolytica TaxID=1859457 RepID=A0A1S1MYF1_9GAMM|nr:MULTISPECIES: GNAT family N-acetyltransferase [Pseudoalteromonas]OHU90227.1 GNAT family N-acetyltransferase [Pseudoalteromonas sp. JW3]OHU92406.1 GNAT family N-acetyltransferase [Pseudoalteromonas amylolytica]
MVITELRPEHHHAVIKLANQVHGDNYLDAPGLKKMVAMGTKFDINACFVALDEQGQLLGFRTSYAAEQWPIDKWCTPKNWPVLPSQMAYFKCIAVAPEAQGQGIGPKLLHESIVALRQQGALAGVAHLWMQSPGNGAVKYFSKAGGKLVKVHDDRWLENCLNDGYVCTICGNECHCQAAEMALMF